MEAVREREAPSLGGGGGEREQLQYRLMEDRLSRFCNGEIDLGRTFLDLRALRMALGEPTDAWWRLLTDEWSDLELAYAVALRNGGPVPDATDVVLGQASRNMLELIRRKQIGLQ